MGTSIANILIPHELKEQALEGLRLLTDPIDAGLFQDFIDRDVSLWRQVTPPELQVVLKTGAQEYMTWINMASENLILSWFKEGRPDLAAVMNTEASRLWFFKQMAEIKREISQ